MAITAGDAVTMEYTGRLDDGTVFDTTSLDVAEEAGIANQQPDREFQPLTVEVGEGNLIAGLETGLLGLEVGATETITVPPEDAYGEDGDGHVREFGVEEFESMVGQEAAEGVEVQTQGGATGTVAEVADGVVSVDFEHPLAGETLTFEIEIVDVE
jgi:FKBP-type peptidyl-prolyl cis-trans isomerase 2